MAKRIEGKLDALLPETTPDHLKEAAKSELNKGGLDGKTPVHIDMSDDDDRGDVSHGAIHTHLAGKT